MRLSDCRQWLFGGLRRRSTSRNITAASDSGKRDARLRFVTFAVKLVAMACLAYRIRTASLNGGDLIFTENLSYYSPSSSGILGDLSLLTSPASSTTSSQQPPQPQPQSCNNGTCANPPPPSPPRTTTAATATSSSGNNNNNNNQKNKYSRYAYAFVLGVCDPENPKYRGYLYGIYNAVYLLRSYGSLMDIHLFIEMYHGYGGDTLPPEEEEMLSELGVIVHYIPKPKQQSFYRLTLSKFRVLGLTQYRRVLYMDADQLPTANLDYLFHYSDPEITNPPLLQENMATQGAMSPVNSGFFMITPHPGDSIKITSIIQKVEKQVYFNGYFNTTTGWGTPIGEEGWHGVVRSGRVWDFFDADGDQGLLYHWLFNVQHQASIIQKSNNQKMFDIVPDPKQPHGYRRILKQAIRPKDTYFVGKCQEEWCLSDKETLQSFFLHYSGRKKPWEKEIPSDLGPSTKFASKDHFWLMTLEEVAQKYNRTDSIQVRNLNVMKKYDKQSDVSTSLAQDVFASNSVYLELTDLLDRDISPLNIITA